MKILGIINSDEGTASLIDNRGIVSAAAEERFSRIKLHKGFPHQAVKFILKNNDLNIKDIDILAYCWGGVGTGGHGVDLAQRTVELITKNPYSSKIISQRLNVVGRQDNPAIKELLAFAKNNKLENKLEIFDHHLGHAASGFFYSPFKKSLVFTCDARGNYQSVGVYLGQGTSLKELEWTSLFDSPGFLYGAITDLLGFKAHRHEGKITGLAAFGNPKKLMPIMRQMITLKDGKIRADVGNYYKPFFTRHLPKLKKALRGYSKEDVAAALQKQFEHVISNYIERFVKKYRVNNVCLAGGVFANVKLNQRIRELKGVNQVFIYPNMGDGGLATGAALLSLAKRNKRPTKALGLTFFGPDYSNRNILNTLKKYKNKIKYQKLKDKVSTTIDLLQQEKVVGWFQGKMEYGPRALGNRSVLYHAKDPDVNNWLNKRLKRTEFMPFAPFTTNKLAPRCFKGWKPSHLASKYMTMCYDCTTEMKRNSPAVVHVDGTARPQVVWRKDNPDYYDIADGFYKKTGALSLVNTSFNQHEHPIVCSPKDAVESLLQNNVDVLIMGNYLVEKIN